MKLYEIVDEEEFIKSIREIMLEHFFKEVKKKKTNCKKNKQLIHLMKEHGGNLEKKLTIEETKSIASPILKQKQKDGKTFITHKDFREILEELNKRIISNILVELTKEGVIESAFDNEQNDFIFWVKD